MNDQAIFRLQKKIRKFPKAGLIRTPTPFYHLSALSRALGGPQIYIKREDMTGLAFGGNKSRKLEFIIQDVLRRDCDVVITWAGLQSNWCLQTAAAARKFGLSPILVLFKTYDLPAEYDGNILLDFILDAEIRIEDAEKGKVVSFEAAQKTIEEISAEQVRKGRRPYIAPIGGSLVGGSMTQPLGAVAYAEAYAEMYEQAGSLGFCPDYVLLASGSGGTQAGLIVGAEALEGKTKILGISVSDEKESFEDLIASIVKDTSGVLDIKLDVRKKEMIRVYDEYLAEGYGVVNRDVARALRLVAETEGIFIDPVYTGKAVVALIDLIRKGAFRPTDRVVFLHTGGTAALFPNRASIQDYLSAEE